MSHPIPSAALAHHIAFLGKTGSGKSNAARAIIEDSLDAGERVCVIDPTGAWWGLRLSRNGKASKYPVVIFGGLHGDVPIGREHGAAVAEVVATSSTPAVIDTRLMTVGERTQFFTTFAQTLLRKNKGPLRLVIDEAHVFAPQGRVADPRSGEMLHAANNLVSLGRSIGLRIMLISQRPAKLHKDSLTQVETLVAMRVIAPQDRKAIEEWIGDQADKEQGKEIIASLPSLKTGDAWIWSPEVGFLERSHFPLARTYDSGKAPTDGEGGPELQPLKLDEVNKLLDQAAEELRASDPRHLKAEVARLIRELAAVRKAAPAPAWPDQRQLVETLSTELAETTGTLERLRAGATELRRRQDAALAALTGEKVEVPAAPRRKALPYAVDHSRKPVVEHHPRGEPRRPAEAPIRHESVPAVEGITGPQQRILDALAWWRAFGIDQPTNEQVGFVAGYAPGSGNFNNLKGGLRSLGLIDYPVGGKIVLTDAGAAAAREPYLECTRDAFHAAVRAKLKGPQVRLLDPVLAAYPESIGSDDVAAAAGYAPGSGNFNNLRGSLKSIGLFDYPSPGVVRAADWLFP